MSLAGIPATTAIVASLAMLAASCSGARPHPPSATSATPPTAAPTPPIAGPVNLSLSDFPSGWAVISVPAGAGTSDPEAAALLTCLHLPATGRHVVSDSPSDVFSSGLTVQASSDVTVLTSPTAAATEVAALKAAGGLTCLGQVIGQGVASQGTAVTGASIRAIPGPGPVTDPTLAVRYQATFTMKGQSLSAVTDEYFIAHGNEEVTATFSAFEQPFPASVEQTALAHLVARVVAS